MPKRAEPLTAAGVRTAKPGIHVDGGGLMLVVTATGAAKWMLRYQIAGRRRDMGLGTARGPGAVSLAEARSQAEELRKLVRAGTDPLQRRDADAEAARMRAEAEAQAARAEARTFQAVAEMHIAAHSDGWRSAIHRAQWTGSLEKHVYPLIGALPVASVGTEQVLAVLRQDVPTDGKPAPLWTGRPETAGRLRGRMEAILAYATARGWREGENPARWRGHLSAMLPKQSKVATVEHFPALPWQEIGAFMVRLRGLSATAARALEFAILTAARSGEVLGAKWSEMDLDAAVWVVPASRMKAGREHRVPLSTAALAVLRGMLPLRPADGDGYVFLGQKEEAPLSTMAMLMLLRRMGRTDLTAHGFRSSFRDWTEETTSTPHAVAEMALAHTIGNKAEAAYRRGDLFQKRAALMQEWADYCAKAPAEVVTLRPGATATA